MNDFLKKNVIPSWTQTLGRISQKQRALCIKQGRNNYVQKEFWKDIRNFHHIMFRLRFHRSDKRTDGYNQRIVRVFLNELGIWYEEDNISDRVFIFFYKVHYNQRKPNDKNEFDQFMQKQKLIDNDLLFKEYVRLFLLNQISYFNAL